MKQYKNLNSTIKQVVSGQAEKSNYNSVESLIKYILTLKNQPKTDKEKQIDSMKQEIAKQVDDFSTKQARTDTDE